MIKQHVGHISNDASLSIWIIIDGIVEYPVHSQVWRRLSLQVERSILHRGFDAAFQEISRLNDYD